MQIFHSPAEFQAHCLAQRQAGQGIALVPTMGYFHEGHLSLMRHARTRGEILAVSLFVNPTQFGENEDLSAYPRDFQRDAELARSEGVDILFAPEPEAVYAPDHATWVQVPELARGLCGKDRPVHFSGVATVVTKLFNLAQPTVAVFGEKDWQQLALIRRMVRDLNIPVRVEGCPIVREPDGLALSSRNVYLTDAERTQAPAIQSALALARDAAAAGETSAGMLRDIARAHLAAHASLGREDYLEIIDPDTLREYPDDAILTGDAVMATAIRFGKARLLDNIRLVPVATTRF